MYRGLLLLVESSPTQANHFRLHFGNLGYNVITAHNGGQALELLNQIVKVEHRFPDLIITDLVLPDQSGAELCLQIKANLMFKTIPILVVSAENNSNATVRAYACGASYYQAKEGENFEKIERLISRILPQSSTVPNLLYNV